MSAKKDGGQDGVQKLDSRAALAAVTATIPATTVEAGNPAKTESKLEVLIVEDDNTFRRLLSRTLTSQGYAIRQAENGQMAKEIFDQTPEAFQLVISDVRMPKMNGNELLKHIRATSKVPFIVMTGFSEILDAQDAYSLGANEFIPKPFRVDMLLEAVRRCLSPEAIEAARKKEEANRQKFCAIHIDEFISSTNLISDVYVKLGDSKYVKVAYKGDAIPVARLRTYKDRQVDHLYVTLQDFSLYVSFNVKVASAAVGNRAIPTEKKARLLKRTSEIILEKCFLDEIDHLLVKPAQRMVEDFAALAYQDIEILEIITDLGGHADKLYSHSVAVAVYSNIIARRHGWSGAGTYFRLTVGSLLHDIGYREIDPELLKKRRELCTPDENKLIESHAARGRDIVSKMDSLPEDVAVIVAQHHETSWGTGYPLRLRDEAVHPLARLIGSVDRFVERVIPPWGEIPAEKPDAALLWLQSNATKEIDQTVLKHLMDMFKVAQPSSPEAERRRMAG